MRLGEPVEWALHCTTVLALLPSDGALPASKLAEFHGVPAPYLAKTLQALSREGILESVPGRRGGDRGGQPPAADTPPRRVAAGPRRPPGLPGRQAHKPPPPPGP